MVKKKPAAETAQPVRRTKVVEQPVIVQQEQEEAPAPTQTPAQKKKAKKNKKKEENVEKQEVKVEAAPT